MTFARVVAALLRRWRAADAAPHRQAATTTGLPGVPAGTGHLRRIGPYRIDGQLGSGATGAVLRAVDERSGEAVALKTMALAAPAGEALAGQTRFLREAALARRLRHPNIVAVRDAGVDRGTAYIAMELHAGSDLRAFTQQGSLLPVAQVLSIAARVAEALAYAHRQGVVHRDVKPSNILFDAAADRVQLTDFGIAHAAGGAADATRSGLLLGTVAFMSPEQLAGARADAASDLYALGATLFALLAGRLPHEAASLSSQMQAIANQPPPDLRAVRPGIAEPVARTVARLLAKAPAERGADGDALAAELRGIAAAMTGVNGDACPGSNPVSRAPLSGALPAREGRPPADPMHNPGP